jgi:galactokinase
MARAPGRVNLLGEHVDYNDGFVLPVAIDRAVFLAAAPTPEEQPVVTLHALDLDARASFHLHQLDTKLTPAGQRLPDWALYPAGVAWALQAAGYPVKGADICFTSTVPIGAGLSSSAAVEVGFAVIWQALGNWPADPMTLAKICQQAENFFVGVSCGLMDQFASACGVEGHALYLDTRSLLWEPAQLPTNASIVIADSGIRRSLASSAYNERRAACEEAVAILKQFIPGIQALRDVSPQEFMAYSSALPQMVRKRAEHVVKEIARVESALSALRRNDRKAFGALMYAGHASLKNLYEVSTPELDALVDIARDLPGCIGARLTGAGFGGCTVNLVETDQAEGFILGLQNGYTEHTGRMAQVYLCQASEGARVIT